MSFEKADRELCFHRIRPELRMPEENLHFPKTDLTEYLKSWNSGVRCVVMQRGQGGVKHWAFNDPVRRQGRYKDNPPTPAEYPKLTTRIVDLHPITLIQNARTSGGGVVQNVPGQALTVGPVETWKAEKVSIWGAVSLACDAQIRTTSSHLQTSAKSSVDPFSLFCGNGADGRLH
jgi:glucosamine-6-phosphate deaminase